MKYLVFLILLIVAKSVVGMDRIRSRDQDECNAPLECENERVAKKSRYGPNEFIEKICCISCEPTKGALQKLVSPPLCLETEEWTIVAHEKSFKIPRNAIELSGLWRDNKSFNRRITFYKFENVIVERAIKCLVAMSHIKPSMNYGYELHCVLKPIISHTNILKLTDLIEFLEVPVLLDYLKTVILTYLLQEADINRLGSFVRTGTTILRKPLLDYLCTEVLKARKNCLLKHFIGAYITPLCTLEADCCLHECAGISFGLKPLVIAAKKQGMTELMYFQLLGNRLSPMSKRSLDFGTEAEKIFVDNKGIRIVAFTDKKLLRLVPDLATISYQSLGIPLEDFDQRFISLGSLVCYSPACTWLIDPNLANFRMQFSSSTLITSYNGTYITTFDFSDLPKQSEQSMLWLIENDGSLVCKGSFNLSSGITEAILESQRILSPEGTYLWCNQSSMDKSWVIHTKDGTVKNSVPCGQILACTEGGLALIAGIKSLILYDLYGDYSFELNHPILKQHGISIYKAFFSDDDSFIYVIIKQNEPDGTSKLQTLVFDLHTAAQNRSLQELIALIHVKSLSQSKYLKAVYAAIPAYIRER